VVVTTEDGPDGTVAGEQNHVSTDSLVSCCPKFEMAKIQRPGAILRAREEPRGGAPWGKSTSGHGAQAASVIYSRTLAPEGAQAHRRRRAKPATTKKQRPGATLQATEGPCGGAPRGLCSTATSARGCGA